MIDTPELVVAALVMLAGATVMSTLGFGIGITTSPILLLVLEPQTVVVMLNTVSLVLFALIIYQTRAHITLRDILPTGVAGMVGVPIGVLVLSLAGAGALRIGITVLVIALTLSLRFPVPAALVGYRPTGPAIGLAVGALLAASGVGGPLIVLYLLARDMPRHAVRGQLSVFFLMVESVAVVGYAVAGLFTLERLSLILVMTAPVLLGYSFATLLVRRMDEVWFRRGVIGLILGTSLMVLGREVLRLQGVA